MITVIDHAKPWLTPRRALAAMTHFQLGAHMIMKGTGRPTSHPSTRTRLRPQASANWPDTRLAHAFTMPKLTMKETTSVVEPILNSSAPISGTTVRSIPTIPPTNALIRSSNVNCGQFSFKPSLTGGAVCGADMLSLMESGRCGSDTGIGCPDLGGLRRRRRNLRHHEANKLGFVRDHEGLVVPLLKADGRPRFSAEPAAADRAGIGAGHDLDIVRKLPQPARAVEQLLRPFLGIGRKLGAAEIADHQRVASEHKPRLLAARVVGDENADV